MKRLFWIAVVVALALPCATAAQKMAAIAAFTVRAADGQLVPVLSPDDVEVFEDSAPRRVIALDKHDETTPATVIFVIDDLHLEFQSTPRTRDLMLHMAREAIRSGDRAGVVATGSPAGSPGLSFGSRAIEAAVPRMMGRGLKPAQLLDGARRRERRGNAETAFRTIGSLLSELEPMPGRKIIVLISSGWEGGHEETIATLARDASAAHVVIDGLEPRGIDGDTPPQNPPVDPGTWNAYRREALDSLLALTAGTGGTVLAKPGDLGSAIRVVNADAREYYLVRYETATGVGAETRLMIRTKNPRLAVSHANWGSSR
jgi:VWFA-related protein